MLKLMLLQFMRPNRSFSCSVAVSEAQLELKPFAKVNIIDTGLSLRPVRIWQ